MVLILMRNGVAGLDIPPGHTRLRCTWYYYFATAFVALTLIILGFTFSAFGSMSCSTPLSNVASTLVGSIAMGKSECTLELANASLLSQPAARRSSQHAP